MTNRVRYFVLLLPTVSDDSAFFTYGKNLITASIQVKTRIRRPFLYPSKSLHAYRLRYTRYLIAIILLIAN
jgi:hypothetical protein